MRTLPDGTTEVVYPDDYALDSGYCDPPAADARDEAEDIVRQNPPPLWLKLLVWTVLGALLVGGVALVLWLLVEVVLPVDAVAAARTTADRGDDPDLLVVAQRGLSQPGAAGVLKPP